MEVMEEISLKYNCGDRMILELKKIQVPTKYLKRNTYELKLIFGDQYLTFVAIIQSDRCKRALEIHSFCPAVAL